MSNFKVTFTITIANVLDFGEAINEAKEAVEASRTAVKVERIQDENR